jgi:tRNA 2-selenouridine synthase SelU
MTQSIRRNGVEEKSLERKSLCMPFRFYYVHENETGFLCVCLSVEKVQEKGEIYFAFFPIQRFLIHKSDYDNFNWKAIHSHVKLGYCRKRVKDECFAFIFRVKFK